ncbi:hypothetical protein EASAB2608_00151 [Streptomyces sp. EAS-AB2608]|uniref:Uncharacterized protein n=1 Tax=Streptomyces bangladeshensis TaxID=295352 RepID=A0ABN3BI10_9ACTN|nr:hypothetical protein EASAB2608_00151 [Streptomyces sp. EAS-AB2608]
MREGVRVVGEGAQTSRQMALEVRPKSTWRREARRGSDRTVRWCVRMTAPQRFLVFLPG